MPDSYWIQKARRHLWNLSQRFKSGVSCSAGCERSFTEQIIRLTRNRKTSYAEEFDMCLDLSFGIGPFFYENLTKTWKDRTTMMIQKMERAFENYIYFKRHPLSKRKWNVLCYETKEKYLKCALTTKKSAILFHAYDQFTSQDINLTL
jgi:hypothetical protein